MSGRHAGAHVSKMETWAERFPAHQARQERIRLAAGRAPRRAHRDPLPAKQAR